MTEQDKNHWVEFLKRVSSAEVGDVIEIPAGTHTADIDVEGLKVPTWVGPGWMGSEG